MCAENWPNPNSQTRSIGLAVVWEGKPPENARNLHQLERVRVTTKSGQGLVKLGWLAARLATLGELGESWGALGSLWAVLEDREDREDHEDHKGTLGGGLGAFLAS